jgi:hypothetical protein
MLMAETVAGDNGLNYERNVRFAFVFAGGCQIHSRFEGWVAAEQIVRRAIFLYEDDYVLNFALRAGRILPIGNGNEYGTHKQRFACKSHGEPPGMAIAQVGDDGLSSGQRVPADRCGSL